MKKYMETNKIYKGDCLKLINDVPENCIDLIITSPPYADTKSYGKKVNVFHPDKYVEWILPLFKGFENCLKSSGSIIFNIDDKCINKLRHPYIFQLILTVIKETKLKLYDYYFWQKAAFLPNGNDKRLNHSTEWLLHFVKDPDKVKWDMDSVRIPYKETSLSRNKSPVENYIIDENGIKTKKGASMKSLNENGCIPKNVLNFNTCAVTRGNKHPAPFHKDLPVWFIKALTEENDIVLDPFIGGGTTACASIELNRQWIGFELNQFYINMAMENIKIEENKFKTKNNYKLFF